MVQSREDDEEERKAMELKKEKRMEMDRYNEQLAREQREQ